MSDTITLPKKDLEKMIRNLADLQSMVNTIITRTKRNATKEPREHTNEEMLMLASESFNITRAPDPDDDLISPNAVIKPIDW